MLDSYGDDLIHKVKFDSDTEDESFIEEISSNKAAKTNFNLEGSDEQEEVPEAENARERLPETPDESKWDILYGIPLFIKPGRHNYLIKYKNTKEKY